MTALPPDRLGRAAEADLLARRGAIATAAECGLWRTDPPPAQAILGGVRCLRFDPPDPPRGTVLHLHGGAFRIGQPEQVAPFAAALAARCRVTVICPAYRLAPEHPFPAALHDATAVLGTLDGPVILSGDSAGGGLAAALATIARPIAGLVLLSAWLDLTVTAASYAANADTDPLFSDTAAREAAALYLQGTPATAPLASPLHAAADAFPPTHVNVGAGEVLVDDARAFHERLADAGVPAELSIIPGMEHVAVTRGRDLPGAAETFAAIATFIDARLG